MHHQRRHPRRAAVGWLILAILAGIAAMTFFLELLDPRVEPVYGLTVLVPATPPLRGGAPVWVAGREVGRVVRVDLPRPGIDPEGIGLIVAVEIRQPMQAMIRRDSQARVARSRLLDPPGINIRPGSPGHPVLADGDTIVVTAAVDVGVYVRRAERLSAAMDSLRATLAQLEPRTARAAALARGLDADLARVRAEADMLSRELREGAGAARLRDPDLRATIERVRATFAEISRLVRDRRLELEPHHLRLAESLRSLRREIAAIETLLDEPFGTVPRLAADPALRNALREAGVEIDRLLEDLAAEPLRSIF